ncbi:hypothetical protein K488DRAFT_57317 [Vararia minispora EC-137]|uniref:Uncharacterized protein n=1 Tax=Vararia minispora EC-137 TaxID=1314806 RepID=A0ACB8QB21_9AGAM|nr:hypothetical protein K488DRAFT_57317 [Vararia minispora EC-137]
MVDETVEQTDNIAEWVNDDVDDTLPKTFDELEVLANEGTKRARKAGAYREEALFASLRNLYHLAPRLGRGRAALRVANRICRGPAYARVLCAQARYFEANGMLQASRQGKHLEKRGLLTDEGLLLGIRRFLRTQAAGKVNPLLLMRHINEHILPSLQGIHKARVGETWARSTLLSMGYRRKKHSKGVYFDGHERADVKKRRVEFLNEIEGVKRFRATYDGPEMSETLPILGDGEQEHIFIYQDEAAFHANDAQNVNYWLKEGQQVLKKKGRGRLIMVSGYICERFGNLALPENMVANNAKLPLSERLEVTDARVIIYPSSKAGGDAYWNREQMITQTALKIARVLFPQCVIHWIFDNSSCHNCMDEDALTPSKMNVHPGGTNPPSLHETIIPANNPFGKGGQPQAFLFPTSLAADHPYKGFEGKPKGMAVILEERGYLMRHAGEQRKKNGYQYYHVHGPSKGKRIVGDCQRCKDRKSRKDKLTERDGVPVGTNLDAVDSEDSEPEDNTSLLTDCCMRRMLSLQDDFQGQKSMLEKVIEEAGDICHFLPKFHPEINPKEYYWGWTKRYFRERSTGQFKHAQKLLKEALDACPLITIRRFFRRVERYMSVYQLGATGVAAEFAVKKYKSHRGVSQRDLDGAEEERRAREAKLVVV